MIFGENFDSKTMLRNAFLSFDTYPFCFSPVGIHFRSNVLFAIIISTLRRGCYALFVIVKDSTTYNVQRKSFRSQI